MFVSQKKGGTLCGTNPSPTVTRERLLRFTPFFCKSLSLLNLHLLGGTPQNWDHTYAVKDRSYLHFLTMAEARDFHCYSHASENLGTGPPRATTRQYVLSFKSRLIKDTKANASRLRCRNITLSVLFWSGSTKATDTLPSHLARSKTKNYHRNGTNKTDSSRSLTQNA